MLEPTNIDIVETVKRAEKLGFSVSGHLKAATQGQLKTGHLMILLLIKKLYLHICERCWQRNRSMSTAKTLFFYVAVVAMIVVGKDYPGNVSIPIIVVAVAVVLYVLSLLNKGVLQIKELNRDSVSIVIGDDIYQMLDLPLKRYVAANGVNSN